MEAHKPISHYFCKGKDTGMRIMNKDAKIALDIVNHLQNTIFQFLLFMIVLLFKNNIKINYIK